MKEFLLAFLGSFAGAVLFNIERYNLLWAGLCGGIAWTTYEILIHSSGRAVYATFISAIFVGLFSEFMARRAKTPAYIFSIPGMYPLVPGIMAFDTIYLLVFGKMEDGINKGIETAATAGAIAFGIMLSSTGYQLIERILYEIFKNKAKK
ncbi:threonine/serine exporter family protein [Caloramator mitchellensis]|nr:threonine/serine exporter family protein [Caloramator mitchellensis]